jgi:hypothetical protein
MTPQDAQDRADARSYRWQMLWPTLLNVAVLMGLGGLIGWVLCAVFGR